MAGTLSQKFRKFRIGKIGQVPVGQVDSVGEGDTDSVPSNSTGNTPSESPRPSFAGADMLDHGVAEKSQVEKKSSWSFHRSKHKKESSKEWPKEFVCPISKSLMADPVIVASGESYERQCIQIWLQQGHRHCFKTGATLEHHSLTTNIALRSAIHTWCEKHRVPKPQGPTMEAATQSVENSAQSAFMSEGSESSFPPSIASDSLRPGFGSDSGRPGFGVDERPIPNDTNPTRSPGNSGSYNSGNYENQWGHDREIEPVEQVGPASWASAHDYNKPLWVRRQHSGSRGSSVEYDRKTSSSVDYSERLGKDPSLQSSTYTDGCSSSEWPAPSPYDRYVHSASANTLREDMEGLHGRGRTPLPLETTPSSYQSGEAGRTEERGMVTELISKLRHRHALEQEEAAGEIRRLTRNTEPGLDYRLALCTPEVLGALVPLLLSRYGGVQVNAIAAIMNLSLANENKVKIARAGAIPPLIDCLQSRNDAAQEHSAGALFSMALNDENKMAIGVLGAIPPLIHVLRAGPPGAQRDAAMALYHLSFAHINRGKLIKAGAVPILLQLVQEESSDLVSRGLLILCNLAAVQEGRSAICEGHGIAVFVGLLSEGADNTLSRASVPDGEEPASRGGDDWASVREHAAAALLQLSHHNSFRFKTQALQAGAIEPLSALQVSGTQRARDKATALLNILRESPNQNQGDEGEALYARALYRRGNRGGPSSNSSNNGAPKKSDSAQF